MLWKPGDSRAPCTYTLEQRVDGEGPAGWWGWGGRAGGRQRSWGDECLPRARVPRLLTDGTGSLGHPFCGLSPSPMLPVGESSWHPVSSGIPDCYYNVTHLPVGITVRFRVACANRAGQGPFSSPSDKVLVRGMRGQWDRVGDVQRGQGTLSPGSTPSLEHPVLPLGHHGDDSLSPLRRLSSAICCSQRRPCYLRASQGPAS